MAQAQTPYDGSAAAATLHPLERALAAALAEHRLNAEKHGRASGTLAETRAVLHALARYMLRDGQPAEAQPSYVAHIASAHLRAQAWCRFRDLERLGIEPHAALFQAIDEARAAAPNVERREPCQLAVFSDRGEGNAHA